eukprot:2560315-Amphidinium_carterae.1
MPQFSERLQDAIQLQFGSLRPALFVAQCSNRIAACKPLALGATERDKHLQKATLAQALHRIGGAIVGQRLPKDTCRLGADIDGLALQVDATRKSSSHCTQSTASQRRCRNGFAFRFELNC